MCIMSISASVNSIILTLAELENGSEFAAEVMTTLNELVDEAKNLEESFRLDEVKLDKIKRELKELSSAVSDMMIRQAQYNDETFNRNKSAELDSSSRMSRFKDALNSGGVL